VKIGDKASPITPGCRQDLRKKVTVNSWSFIMWPSPKLLA
jgi:hypothetical protein